LQLNPDKSEALIVGTANQLHAVTSAVTSVSVSGVDLSVANDMKALGVVLDRRLTFQKHAMAVARSCNYHSQAICHIHNLLSTELAVTLTCSLILTRLDYYNTIQYNERFVRHRSTNGPGALYNNNNKSVRTIKQNSLKSFLEYVSVSNVT